VYIVPLLRGVAVKVNVMEGVQLGVSVGVKVTVNVGVIVGVNDSVSGIGGRLGVIVSVDDIGMISVETMDGIGVIVEDGNGLEVPVGVGVGLKNWVRKNTAPAINEQTGITITGNHGGMIARLMSAPCMI